MATAIIPAAGKGTRMGSPVDGKELMIDPQTGRPLIDFAIMAAQDAGYDHIVVAIETGTKVLLQQHIRETFPEVYIHLGKQEGEWPSTVLQTVDHWHIQDNVLILPDTRFNPEELKDLKYWHESYYPQLSFACLPGPIHEPDKYGVIALQPFSGNPVWTAEKPADVDEPQITAWGLIAFDKPQGEKLFKAYTVRGRPFQLATLNATHRYLTWFKDITRNGYVETY